MRTFNRLEPIHATWGQEVFRTEQGILKTAVPGDGMERYEARCQGIAREAVMLDYMQGSGITPRLIDVGEDWILLEDLGPSRVPSSGEDFRRACVRLLWHIRQAGVIHGDLTFPNIIFGGRGAWAVDWQDASWVGEEPPLQKHERSDSYLLWRTVRDHHDPSWSDSLLADTPRVARRWLDVLVAEGADRGPTLEGKSLLDLGCFQGDFTAAAAVEGMEAYGIDQGGFRQGEDSIEIARELWDDDLFPHAKFRKGDIPGTHPSERSGFDVVLLFSTWPYFLEDCAFGQRGPLSREDGWALIDELARGNGVLYFETQYAGDGPGPHWLPDDDAVRRTLTELGLQFQDIGKHPVAGRPAERTVWRIWA